MKFDFNKYLELKDEGLNPVIKTKKGNIINILEVDSEKELPILMEDKKRYSFTDERLILQANNECPIIDGRIVSDKTFAIRFREFLEGIIPADCIGYEELEYLKYVSKKLLDWQIKTATSEEELSYLENIGQIKRDR